MGGTDTLLYNKEAERPTDELGGSLPAGQCQNLSNCVAFHGKEVYT